MSRMVPRSDRQEVDLVAYDRAGRRVLIAEVKAVPVSDPDKLAVYTAARVGETDYVLVVDPFQMRLYQDSAGEGRAPVALLDTVRMLSVYDPNLGKTRVFEQYLTTLVEAWLRDLAYQWKGAVPPGSQELKDTGLLDRLKDGTTETEVSLGGHSVR